MRLTDLHSEPPRRPLIKVLLALPLAKAKQSVDSLTSYPFYIKRADERPRTNSVGGILD